MVIGINIMKPDINIPRTYMDQLEFYQRCVVEGKYLDQDFIAEQRDDMEFGLDAFSAFYYTFLAGEPCPCREPIRLSQLMAASKGVNTLVESMAWDLITHVVSTKDFDVWRRTENIPEWLTTEIYCKKSELNALSR